MANKKSQTISVTESIVKAAVEVVKSTPEGIPENAEYIEPDEEVPQGYTELEGPGGGTYAVESEEETEESDNNRVQNVEDAKEPIPEYTETNAAEVHDEASKMAKKNLAPKATEKRQNMIIDKVATTPDTTMEMIENMKEQGYDIRASFVNFPKKKAIFNAVSRYYEAGRFTPLDYVDGAVEQSRNSFEEIIEEANIPEDKVGRFDNDVEWGEPPDVEDMGEELLKFYRIFFGWTNKNYKLIENQSTYGENDDRENRKTSGRRKFSGDSTVDGTRLRSVSGGRNGARQRRR